MVELTLIIFLAGVLVALALPRILATDLDRHEAQVQGVMAGLTTALELYEARQEEFGLTPGVVNAGDCATLWKGLLQSAAPVVRAVDQVDDVLGSSAPYTAIVDATVCQYFHTAAGSEPGDRIDVISYDSVSGALSRAAHILRPPER